MEKIETKFNEFGWKLVIKKSKEGIVTIAQRNKDSAIHMMHKPIQLRLQPEELKELKKMLRRI